MQSWVCTICEYVYNPAEGDSANDVPPGVSFEELLVDWTCPVCKSGKLFFHPLPPET